MQLTHSILISGKVQGVFYRQSAKEKAIELGITGTVRNLDNGDVEIIASGTLSQLDALAAWCRQGPPKARVTDIIIHQLPVKNFDAFTIMRS